MSNLKIAVLCGGPFAGYALTKLGMEKFLGGIVIGSRNRQAVDMLRAGCEQSNLPFEHIANKDDLTLLDAWLDLVQPDAVFCICFPYRIPATTLAKLPNRFFNFHTGPLPAFRGPSPIFEVIRKQEKSTAITVHHMNEAYDNGDIVFEERVPLTTDETYVSLANKLSNRCGYAALNMAEMLQFASHIPAKKQDESTARFYPFPDTPALTIDWEQMSAEEIMALIRAAGGWTRGAITHFGDEQIRISSLAAEAVYSGHDLTPGTILAANHQQGYTIACKDGKQIDTGIFSSDYGDLGADYYRSAGLDKGSRLTNSILKTIE